MTLYSIMDHVIGLTNCHEGVQRLECLLRIQTGRGKDLYVNSLDQVGLHICGQLDRNLSRR